MSFICIICHDLLSNANEVLVGASAVDHERRIISSKCGHLYHFCCLNGWFTKKGESEVVECPACCAEIKMEDCLRIYPLGDEESQNLEMVMTKCTGYKEELEKSTLTVEILRYELNTIFEEVRKFKEERNEIRELARRFMEAKSEGNVEVVEECQEALIKLVEPEVREIMFERLQRGKNPQTLGFSGFVWFLVCKISGFLGKWSIALRRVGGRK